MPLMNVNRGQVSKKQAARIRYYVNLLIDASKKKRVYSKDENKWFSFKVNLLTLTLPSAQIHTDKEIHEKVFKEFIRFWKRKAPGLIYMYKAEVQDNGNLHYHLTTNTFIHHEKLRNDWNYYCEKLGYVSRSSAPNPNSTDVHSVKEVKKLAAYMVAYLSKKDLYKKPLKRYFRMYGKRLKSSKEDVCKLPKRYFEMIKRKVELKVWDCSKVLLLGKCSVEIDNDELMQEVRLIANTAPNAIVKDWCTIIPQSGQERANTKRIGAIYWNHIQKLRDHVKEQPAEYYI